MKIPLNQSLKRELVSLVILLVVFILSFALVVYQLISEIHVGIDFAQKERAGIEYNYILKGLLEDVVQYRSQMNQFLIDNNSLSLKERMIFQQSKIDNDLQRLDTAKNKNRFE